MKALTGSPSLKVGCLEKERWKLFWSQRPEICFLGLPGGRRSGKFSCLSSFERKNIRPIFAASSDLSSSASNSQVHTVLCFLVSCFSLSIMLLNKWRLFYLLWLWWHFSLISNVKWNPKIRFCKIESIKLSY